MTYESKIALQKADAKRNVFTEGVKNEQNNAKTGGVVHSPYLRGGIGAAAAAVALSKKGNKIEDKKSKKNKNKMSGSAIGSSSSNEEENIIQNR